jgi:hypothetical protein
MQASVRYGIQKAVQATVATADPRVTVGQQIEQLLRAAPNPQLQGQVLAALKNPQSVIEIRCGSQVQTVSPDMPLRELLSPEAGEVEITVSQPHVGG